MNVDGRRFAIELDGYNYHGKFSAKEFEKQEERTNEIIRQGYELIRFSFNKIKKKPNEVRRELRQRINIPRSEPSASTFPAPVDSCQISNNEKKSPVAAVIISALILLLLVLLVPYLFVNLVYNEQVKETETTKNNQLSFIQSFIDNHNEKSNRKISNIEQIDLNNESGKYYRRTNTYGSYNTLGVHDTIEGSDIWIISCSIDKATNMRIYVESKDYGLLTDLVHIGVPYLNPNSIDNNERLSHFDSMIKDDTYGLYIDYINGTYTVLKQNNDTGALMYKDKVENWRLNMITGCSDILY